MTQMTYNEILRHIQQLNEEQKQKILEFLKMTEPKEKTENGVISSLLELRENRFKDGIYCVHCDSKKVRRFGTYRGRQRYQCRACRRTFNDLTNTPLNGIKKLDKWEKYLEYMLEGYSLNKCSQLLEIHVSTAFAWRHKVLNALCRNNSSPMKGIVEIDATYERLSFKGQHSLTRKSRKRGKKVGKPGINKEQACFLVARDRNKTTISQFVSLGRFKNNDIEDLLKHNMDSNVVLCTDGETPFLTFCTRHKLNHQIILPEKRVKSGIYHIQNVNSYHGRYKEWRHRFKGVATKYTDNYLMWFNLFERINRLEHCKKLNQILLEITEPVMKLKGYNFQGYYQMLFSELCA